MYEADSGRKPCYRLSMSELVVQQSQDPEPGTPERGPMPIENTAAIVFTLGVVAYIFVDIKFGTTNKMLDFVNRKFGLHLLEPKS